MSRKLAKTVHLRDSADNPVVFKPGDVPPQWAEDQINNPDVWDTTVEFDVDMAEALEWLWNHTADDVLAALDAIEADEVYVEVLDFVTQAEAAAKAPRVGLSRELVNRKRELAEEPQDPPDGPTATDSPPDPGTADSEQPGTPSGDDSGG